MGPERHFDRRPATRFCGARTPQVEHLRFPEAAFGLGSAGSPLPRIQRIWLVPFAHEVLFFPRSPYLKCANDPGEERLIANGPSAGNTTPGTGPPARFFRKCVCIYR